MDELHEASKKTTELQATIKDLESKLAEKEAMIKVLQQHSLDRDNVLQQSILAQRSNLNKHTRSVSSMGLVNSSQMSNGTNNLITRNLKNLSLSTCPNSSANCYNDLTSSNSASSRTSGYSTTSNSSTGSTVNENVMKTTSMVDEQSLKEFDKRLINNKVYIYDL